MNRRAEWVLALAGAAASVAVVAVLWSLQLLPVFVVDVVAAAGVGVLGTALDDERGSRAWGLVTWSAAGALVGGLTLWTASPVAFWGRVAALLFAGAATLADRRHGRAPGGVVWGVFLASAVGLANYWLLIYLVHVVISPH